MELSLAAALNFVSYLCNSSRTRSQRCFKRRHWATFAPASSAACEIFETLVTMESILCTDSQERRLANYRKGLLDVFGYVQLKTKCFLLIAGVFSPPYTKLVASCRTTAIVLSLVHICYQVLPSRAKDR